MTSWRMWNVKKWVGFTIDGPAGLTRSLSSYRAHLLEEREEIPLFHFQIGAPINLH